MPDQGKAEFTSRHTGREDSIAKSNGNYRRTPRGRGKETEKTARGAGTAKTPRLEATGKIAAKT